MTKLNQLIAIEKSVKAIADRDLTNAYHQLQKTALLSGISRVYRPKDDDGDQLPPESTQLILRTDKVIEDVTASLTRLFDVTATKDTANCSARADIRVDGAVLAADLPVTYLLFLEKQLVNLNTFIEKLPTLDTAERWEPDVASNSWATPVVETTRTKKVPKNWVKAEATDKHPAQVEIYHEDVLVGYWSTTKYSGALPATRVAELSVRVKKLLEAVKFAREEANGMEITDVKVGAAVLGYLFA